MNKSVLVAKIYPNGQNDLSGLLACMYIVRILVNLPYIQHASQIGKCNERREKKNKTVYKGKQ